MRVIVPRSRRTGKGIAAEARVDGAALRAWKGKSLAIPMGNGATGAPQATRAHQTIRFYKL